jgi:Mlc titration factor MtfA (ptsG expression regulator)
VGAEAFFVAPDELEREESRLYRLLVEFFRQDPALDKRNGDREAPVVAERSAD